jgi:hypothetical protein
VANSLDEGALTVLTLPGCCSSCRREEEERWSCSQGCWQCANVVVECGRVRVLDARAGPYPLPYLMVQVKDVVWCVDGRDLWALKESATLAVGPGACGPYNRGLKAYAFTLHDERPSHGTDLCLYVCNRD